MTREAPIHLSVRPVATPLDIAAVHDEHAEFVWATLHRLGVAAADLPDLLQEVFVVAHRRRDSFDGSSKVTTWLFSICAKVASTHRRSAYQRRVETYDPQARELHDARPQQDELVDRARARATLDEVLEALDPDKRVVFVMFELEGKSCAEIAEVLGIPVGTVHSRIHSGRADFEKALARRRVRERGRP